MPPGLDPATKALMEDVADRAARRAVVETLTGLGVDHKNPLETQRDFAALRDFRNVWGDPEYRRDMIHLRTWRKTMDGIRKKSIVAAAGFIATSILAAVGVWIKMKFFPGSGPQG